VVISPTQGAFTFCLFTAILAAYGERRHRSHYVCNGEKPVKPALGVRFLAILIGLNATIGIVLFTAALALALAGKRPTLPSLFIPATAAAFCIACALGLWHMKNWSRIVSMLMFGLGAAGEMLQTLVSILKPDPLSTLLNFVALGLMVLAIVYLYMVRDQFH
jgi:hypothetical protein